MLEWETWANCERSQELRRKANSICKKKKKGKKKSGEGNKFKDQNERWNFYKAVDNLKKGFQPRCNYCRNKDSEIIKEEEKVLQWWEECFKEILTNEKEEEGRESNVNDQEERRVIGENEEVKILTCEGIEKRIQKNKEW
jgi:hypothetical protein